MSNELANCACMNLRRTARLIAQFYDQRLQPAGMRTSQFTLLVAVDRLAPVSITHLADQLGMDRTTLTRNIRLLERDGFVEGRPGEDARVRMLSLTRTGAKMIREVRPYWEIAQTDFLKKFGKRRWSNLQNELSDVTKLVASG